MAGMELVSYLKFCRLLVVFICLVRTVPSLMPQVKATKIPSKSHEESVLKDLLNVVERNFDRLTTRIATLESTVSSMHFFSIKQFNQISGSLQTTNNDLGTLKKQMNQIEIEERSQKISLSLIGRDVTELKKSSSDVLGELENSVVYVNENIEKYNDALRTSIEQTLAKTARETMDHISEHMEATSPRNVRDPPGAANCTVDLTDLSEHMDLRFAEMKKQASTHFVKLFASKVDLKKTARESSQELNGGKERTDEKLRNCKNGAEKVGIGKEILTPNIVFGTEHTTKNENLITSTRQPENITNHVNRLENVANNFSWSGNITNHTSRDERKEFGSEEDEKVMNALHNMTSSVLQAVSFFRNTGGMLEQILSNTDSLMIEQADISRRLVMMELREHITHVNGNNETSNVIPLLLYEERQQALKKMFSDSHSSDGRSDDPVVVLDNVARIINNGSQLLEVLTDLAQMSSISMTKVTTDLQDEIKRMENLRTQMVTDKLVKTFEDGSNPFTNLHNTTLKTYKLVEAVASNAGWIPLIFQNVQNLESLVNRSVQIITQNQEILSHVQQNLASDESTQDRNQRANDPTLSNIIPQTLGQMEDRSYNGGNASSKVQGNLHKESLEATYSSNSKLSHTSTKVTKNLPEREHTLRIVSSNGSTNGTEGRLEIYHMGQWRPVCSDGWTVTSASVACLQMGFSSGRPRRVFEWDRKSNTTWLGKTTCTGREKRLDACPNDGWTQRCKVLIPAGVNCL